MATYSHSLISIKLINLQKKQFHSIPTVIALNLPPLKQRNFKIICSQISAQNSGTQSSAPEDKIVNGHLRIMFAASDTGSHIYPAVAIADELRIKNPNFQILFVGTPTGMENTVVPSAGYKFTTFPRPVPSLKNLFIIPYINALIECWRKFEQFNPQILVSTGGCISLLICFIAVLRGVKFVIQEQNSVPRLTNRILSFFADKIFVAFDSALDYFPREKCNVCGNPIRLCLRQYKSKAVARIHFFPKCTKKDVDPNMVLVLGGSLGSNALNIALLNLYYHMLVTYDNLFVIWQTGLQTFDEMESLVKNHPRLILTPFLHSLDLAYAAADLVISRAGAMTCHEIMATGLPSILVPSPNDDEGYQLKNASLMEDLAGSWVITEDELDSTTLGNAIEYILENESLMADMSEKALKSAKPNASSEIADHIISLVS